MESEIGFVPAGGVTSPRGFKAAAACAGIKTKVANSLDLGLIFSEVPCTAAAVFTTNRIKAAPVLLTQQRLQSGRVRAVVVNSGCANAFTGEQGLSDATEIAGLVAAQIGVSSGEVLVASTGIIGRCLRMDRIRAGVKKLVLSEDGGHDLARAIMTTDTVPKEVAVRVKKGGFIIGGAAKGSGMIHPDMATLLCFLTTDAAVELDFLKQALRRAVDISFNMVSVDGDTSTNDMVLIMAGGQAGGELIAAGGRQADVFQQALEQVCLYLARAIARDGEGATKLIEATIKGAASLDEARSAARAVVSSSLVKAAVYGNDPNWGRVVAAIGRSGAAIEETKVDLYMGDVCLIKSGCELSSGRAEAVRVLGKDEVSITVNLNLGTAAATAWGCDLTEEYVKINSEYTT